MSDDAPTCPDCGSEMRLREGRYGQFYGCSTWPKCKATRDVEGRSVEERMPSGRARENDKRRWEQ